MKTVLLLASLGLALGACVAPKTNLAAMQMCSPSISPSDRTGPEPLKLRGCGANPWAASDATATRNWQNLGQGASSLESAAN